MATYLQGYDDYIPQIQPFEPDLATYSKIINERQSKYDEARKQISDLYNSMLNSPMLRQSDIETREKYFQIIDNDIKKLSGMDLSLRQNQTAAANVFTQLLNNKNIAHDMVYTKQAYKALEDGEIIKYSDPKSYWEGMNQLIQMDMNEYKNADDEKALRMSAPTYTKRVNILDEIAPMLDKLDLNITQESVSEPIYDRNGNPVLDANGIPKTQMGHWIVKTKNGQLAEPYMQAMLQSMYGDRGDVLAYYKELSRLNRMTYAYNNADAYGGDINQASNEYVNMSMNSMRESLEENLRMLTGVYENANNKAKSDTRQIENGGLEPYEEKSLKKAIEDYNNEIEGIQKSKENAEKSLRLYDNIGENMSGDAFDSQMAQILLNADISRAAKIASMKNAEVSYKVNPYMQDLINHKYRLAEENNRASNQLAIEKEKSKMRMTEEAFKNLLKGESTGLSYENGYSVFVDPQTGQISDTEIKAGSDEAARLVYSSLQKTLNTSLKEKGLIENEKDIVGTYLQDIRTKADNNNFDAKKEYVDIYGRYAYSLGSEAGEQYEDLVRSANGNIEAIYEKIKGQNISLANINPYDIDNIYSKITNSEVISRETKLGMTNKIDAVNAAKISFDECQKEYAKNIVLAAKSMDAEDQRKLRALLNLKSGQSFDEFSGHFASFDEYANNMGYNKDEKKARKEYDATGEDTGSIQFKLMKELSKQDISPYLSLYSGIHGYGSYYCNGKVVTYNNSNTSGYNFDVNQLIDKATGYDGNGSYMITGRWGSEVPTESDDIAKAVVAEIRNKMYPTKNANHNVTALISSIACDSDKYAAITFKVPSDFKSNLTSEQKENLNEVTIVFDKSKFADNNIVHAMEDTPIQASLTMTGQYTIPYMSSFPKSSVSGNPIGLKLTENGIMITGKMNLVNQNQNGIYEVLRAKNMQDVPQFQGYVNMKDANTLAANIQAFLYNNESSFNRIK